jgi:hypothetical protein
MNANWPGNVKKDIFILLNPFHTNFCLLLLQLNFFCVSDCILFFKKIKEDFEQPLSYVFINIHSLFHSLMSIKYTSYMREIIYGLFTPGHYLLTRVQAQLSATTLKFISFKFWVELLKFLVNLSYLISYLFFNKQYIVKLASQYMFNLAFLKDIINFKSSNSNIFGCAFVTFN